MVSEELELAEVEEGHLGLGEVGGDLGGWILVKDALAVNERLTGFFIIEVKGDNIDLSVGAIQSPNNEFTDVEGASDGPELDDVADLVVRQRG